MAIEPFSGEIMMAAMRLPGPNLGGLRGDLDPEARAALASRLFLPGPLAAYVGGDLTIEKSARPSG